MNQSKWKWKTRIITFIGELFEDWLGETASSKNVKFNITRRPLDPAESEMTIQLNGKRKDVEEIISETKKYLNNHYKDLNYKGPKL